MAPDNYTELKVCRVCLALNVKMYDMKDSKWGEMFQNVTGLLACHKKNTHHRVCWECAARLSAAATFRDKALLSDALLKDLVDIKHSDIVSIRENFNYLKSSLTVHTIFTTSDIDIMISEDSAVNTKEIRIPLHDTDVKIREIVSEINQDKNEIKNFEPYIEVPFEVKVETDTIADNNINVEENKVFSEPNLCNERQSIEKEISNTDDVSVTNDSGEEEDDDKKPVLDENGDIVEDSDSSSSDEDSDEESSSEAKTEMSNNVGSKNGNANVRINDKLKEKIIELKKNGALAVGIAKETGLSISAVNGFWHRYCKSGCTYRRSATGGSADLGDEIEGSNSIKKRRLHKAKIEHETRTEMKKRISKHKAQHEDLKQRIISLKKQGMSTRRVARVLQTSRNTVRKWWERWSYEGHMDNSKVSARKRRKTTPQEDQLLIDRVTQEQSVHTPTLAKELGISTRCVINRLKEAGFRLKQKKASVPLRSGRSHKVDARTKQQIITMKQSGISVTEIANQFRVTRTSVYQWWRRWCKENKIDVTSGRAKSTAIEHDQGVPEDATGNSAQGPPVISSYKSVWQKLPDVDTVS